MLLDGQSYAGHSQPSPGVHNRQFQSEVYARTAANFEASLLRSGEPPARELSAIDEVIVVASCSRSGSSLVVELLKRSGQFIHLCAEINPFLRLAELTWPHSNAHSDALVASHCQGRARDRLQQYLSSEIGRPSALSANVGEDRPYLERLYRRLCLQWPLETFSIEAIRSAAMLAQRRARQTRQVAAKPDLEFTVFFLLFLLELRTAHPPINPYYYDLDRYLIAQFGPSIPVPSGPPSQVLVEEPPFVAVRPWRKMPRSGTTGPLVLKTPSNAYRKTFLRAIFPCARIRTLHLTRNPAASINGLCEGWKHWGFHSHFVGVDPVHAGHIQSPGADQGWWKFDLPPGWQQFAGERLEKICSFQWRSAQTAILETEDCGVDFRVKFEDILSDFDENPSQRLSLRRWLDDDAFLDRPARAHAPVMSTSLPRPGRWRDDIGRLRPVLADPALRVVAEELGYSDEARWV